MMLLNAISRIDELSNLQIGSLNGGTIDLIGPNEYGSIMQNRQGVLSSRVSLVKKPQDPKTAAKVLYNINQTNRLDRLLNNIRSPANRLPVVADQLGLTLRGPKNESTLTGAICVATTHSALTANQNGFALP